MAQYFKVHPDNPQRRLLAKAIDIIRAGGVIAYPTDSSYAVGCHIGGTATANITCNTHYQLTSCEPD